MNIKTALIYLRIGTPSQKIAAIVFLKECGFIPRDMVLS